MFDFHVEGEYQALVYQGETLVHQVHSKNVITQQGKEYFAELLDGQFHRLTRECVVGVSSIPPSDEQTNLLASVAATLTVTSRTRGGTLGNESFSTVFEFAEGALDNVDVSEVGIKTESGVLFSRSLFKNESEQLTPITVLKDQRLVVTYTLKFSYLSGNDNATINIAGIGNKNLRIVPVGLHIRDGASNQFTGLSPKGTYQVTVINQDTFDAQPGVWTSVPASGVREDAGTLQVGNYIPGSRTRIVSVRIPENVGNTGIKAVLIHQGALSLSNPPFYAVVFEEMFSKSNQYRLYIDFEQTW